MAYDIGDGRTNLLGLFYKPSEDSAFGDGKKLTPEQDYNARDTLKRLAEVAQELYPKGRYMGLENLDSIMAQNTQGGVSGYTLPAFNRTAYLAEYPNLPDPIHVLIHENAHLSNRSLSADLSSSLSDPKWLNRLKEIKDKYNIPYKDWGSNTYKEYPLADDFVSDPWSELAVIAAQAPVGVALQETKIGKELFKGFPKQQAAMNMILTPRYSKSIMESTPYLESQYPKTKDNLYQQGIRETLKNFLSNPEPVVDVKGLFESFKDWTKQKRKK